MIITQESTQPLVPLHGQPAVDVPIPREQQDIALALVIALGMVVFDILLEGPSQRTLAKEDHLAQPLKEYVEHYHAERNHQGKGNVLLFPRDRNVHRRTLPLPW